jgi:hypothetical protein
MPKPVKFDLGKKVSRVVEDNTVNRSEAPISDLPHTDKPEVEIKEKVEQKFELPRSEKPERAPRNIEKKLNEERDTRAISVQIPIVDPSVVSEAMKISEDSGITLSRVYGHYISKAKDRLFEVVRKQGQVKSIPTNVRPVANFKTTVTVEDEVLKHIRKNLDPYDITQDSNILARAIGALIATRK